jgi:nickel superoxide dismutase
MAILWTQRRRFIVRAHFIGLIVALALVWIPTTANAHCQVPCGIYDEDARIQAMREDATTIGKAVSKIESIIDRQGRCLKSKCTLKERAKLQNQLPRWVATKESHASRVIKTVSEYFLTQKIKPVPAKDPGYSTYLQKLADHHAVMVAAMKTKQNADQPTVKSLMTAIVTMAKHWTEDSVLLKPMR